MAHYEAGKKTTELPPIHINGSSKQQSSGGGGVVRTINKDGDGAATAEMQDQDGDDVDGMENPIESTVDDESVIRNVLSTTIKGTTPLQQQDETT